MPKVAACLAIVAVLAGLPRQAPAHKLHVFAAVEGKSIRGQAYFRGGDAAAGVPVQALGPAGQPLDKTTTDNQGNFVLPARFRCQYRLVVDAGGGHTAEYRISAQELPADLPPLVEGLSSPDPVGAAGASVRADSGIGVHAGHSQEPAGPAAYAAEQPAPAGHAEKQPSPAGHLHQQPAPAGHTEKQPSPVDVPRQPSAPSHVGQEPSGLADVRHEVSGPAASAQVAGSLEALRAEVLKLREEFDAFLPPPYWRDTHRQ